MPTATVPDRNRIERADNVSDVRSSSPNESPRRTLLGFVATRRIVEIVLTLILGVGGGLLLYGSHFGLDMVQTQLTAQNISFPAAGSAALSPTEFPDLQQYAGQPVDNGPKAKAYADQFIDVHLQSVAGGQTYSQVSAAAQADPNNVKLQGEVATLFKGETLRGLLLNAWGWSVVSTIAFWSGLAALLGALFLAITLAAGYVVHKKNQQVATA